MDPRIARTREAVFEAALALLAERGFAAFSMEGVAAASGVAKSTIYRHWPTKIELLREALEKLNRQPGEELRDVPTREAVERLLTHLAGALSDSVVGRCIPALVEAAEHHREVAEFLYDYSERRRSGLTTILRKGIDQGDIPSSVDPEIAALALSGPIFYRRLMSGSRFAVRDVPKLVEQVLGGRAASMPRR